MADSNTTRQALSASLKSLMAEKSFTKIGVGNICENCGINRKSFYYHFHDKYELVNWIFDVEFASRVESTDSSAQDIFKALCMYFYRNIGFYRKVFNIDGQNSFSEHFKEYCRTAISVRLQNGCCLPKAVDFQSELIAGMLCIAIKKWLCDKEPMPPEEFAALLESGARQTAETVLSVMRKPEKSL